MSVDDRSVDKPVRSRRRPGTTPQAVENRLVALAIERAEQQIRDGTASAQVITHFLKLGSTREQLEQQRIRHENELLEAKREALANQQRIEELYSSALKAMSTYQGHEPTDDED